MFDNERLKLRVVKPRQPADTHNSSAVWVGESISGMNISQKASERRLSPRRRDKTRIGLRRPKKPRTLREAILHSESEAHFQMRVVKLAKLVGWQYVYHVYDSRRSTSGFPDLVMLHPKKRRIAFVELKSMRGDLTLAQRLWRTALELMPQVEYYTWRPSDWSALEEVLRR